MSKEGITDGYPADTTEEKKLEISVPDLSKGSAPHVMYGLKIAADVRDLACATGQMVDDAECVHASTLTRAQSSPKLNRRT